MASNVDQYLIFLKIKNPQFDAAGSLLEIILIPGVNLFSRGIRILQTGFFFWFLQVFGF